MTILSAIKKISVPELLPYGFSYEGKLASVIWMFSRTKDSVKQEVTFQKSNYMKGLRVDFSTSLDKKTKLEIFYSIPNIEKYWWEYNDEFELESTIKELTKIIIDYGIPSLDLMIIPDLEPTEDMAKELLINTEEKARIFSSLYNLHELRFDEAVLRTEEILNGLKGTSFENNREVFIKSAAFIGEGIKKNYGGEWVWMEDFETCALDKIGGVQHVDNPLSWITNYWNKPYIQMYRLTYIHDKIKRMVIANRNMEA